MARRRTGEIDRSGLIVRSVTATYFSNVDDMSGGEQWYSVRLVFRWGGRYGKRRRYEERITIWKASSFDTAIEMAEEEATRYVSDSGRPRPRYLGLAQCYKLADEPGQGAEVFSLLRDTRLKPERYLDRFFNTGTEREQS